VRLLDPASAPTALADADEALYAAKRRAVAGPCLVAGRPS
jgi:hypothetical protein